MRTVLPFKIDVKKAAWITDQDRWAFYHMATNERIAVSAVGFMQSLNPAQEDILVDIVMSEWTNV